MRKCERWNFLRNTWQLIAGTFANQVSYLIIKVARNSDDQLSSLVRAVRAVLAGGAGRAGDLSAGLAISATVPCDRDRRTWRAGLGASSHPVPGAAFECALSYLI